MVGGQAEGARRIRVRLSLMHWVRGQAASVGDRGFAVTVGDVLTGQCMELGGEVPGAVVFR
jgi:hypothetical protein